MVDDASAAVAWALENCAAHGGDPERVLLVGQSAGAHLAVMTALSHAFNEVGDPPWRPDLDAAYPCPFQRWPDRLVHGHQTPTPANATTETPLPASRRRRQLPRRRRRAPPPTRRSASTATPAAAMLRLFVGDASYA